MKDGDHGGEARVTGAGEARLGDQVSQLGLALGLEHRLRQRDYELVFVLAGGLAVGGFGRKGADPVGARLGEEDPVGVLGHPPLAPFGH